MRKAILEESGERAQLLFAEVVTVEGIRVLAIVPGQRSGKHRHHEPTEESLTLRRHPIYST
jgi:hypothetical protein